MRVLKGASLKAGILDRYGVDDNLITDLFHRVVAQSYQHEIFRCGVGEDVVRRHGHAVDPR